MNNSTPFVAAGKSVTVTLSRRDHYVSDFMPKIEEGEKIKLAKSNWGIIGWQRVKNKQMVYRLLKKEYCPHYRVLRSERDLINMSTVLTVKAKNL